MAGSINKVILIGNVGKDPEVRRLESGVTLARLPLATSERYQDKSTGETRSITDWHNIVLWRGLAEIAEKYVRKGNSIYIEGKLKTRSWQDQEGNMRYTTEIVADNMTMLGGRQAEDRQMDQSVGAMPTPQNPATTAQSPVNPIQSTTTDFSTPADEDDDLPF